MLTLLVLHVWLVSRLTQFKGLVGLRPTWYMCIVKGVIKFGANRKDFDQDVLMIMMPIYMCILPTFSLKVKNRGQIHTYMIFVVMCVAKCKDYQ